MSLDQAALRELLLSDFDSFAFDLRTALLAGSSFSSNSADRTRGLA
jgi:hypothetical protein